MFANESPFQFKSVFKYNKLPGNDDTYDENTEDSRSKTQAVVRSSIIFVVCVLIIVTFPFSVWFCVKKVKSLERCVIYRLGKRLPLRGPGLIVTLPCIDAIDFIDLKTQKFSVVKKEPLLTADGSIVECKEFEVEMVVANALRSFTQLKDSKYNVQQFVELSFCNMIGSSDVEDIERRLEFIMKQFVENCNLYINNWGWNLTLTNMPKITVIHRAEPHNAVISALKGYFCPDDQNGKSNFETLVSMDSNQETDSLIVPLQVMANKYSGIGTFGYDVLNIGLSIKDINQVSFYQFSSKTGKVEKIDDLGNKKIHLNIVAKNMDHLMEFLKNEDTSKVEIQNSLF